MCESEEIQGQLAWARKEYRWQVKLETAFPLPDELRPRQVNLRNRNVFDNAPHTIPDVPNKMIYWFFKSDNDCQAFINHVRRFFRMDIDQKLCSKIGGVK